MIRCRGFGSQVHPLISRISCHSDPNTNTNTGLKRCLRCNTLYDPLLNSPTACSFHSHITGEKGLFALAPPHQGIDGEWTDRSGVIVYKWNEKSNRPNTARKDGVAVLSMMRMHLPVEKDGMFPMMTALQCISPLSLVHNSSCIIVDIQVTETN